MSIVLIIASGGIDPKSILSCFESDLSSEFIASFELVPFSFVLFEFFSLVTSCLLTVNSFFRFLKTFTNESSPFLTNFGTSVLANFILEFISEMSVPDPPSDSESSEKYLFNKINPCISHLQENCYHELTVDLLVSITLVNSLNNCREMNLKLIFKVCNMKVYKVLGILNFEF
ncbi:uncharacterized protein TA06195 [Theileria annulata]|uniref:Uncharacterized protein n=1 Tax=Theileria annulata TaxID=5874 RepID=Q4UI75_THEAN|nr:uncharacterized protein TA06195 [Theileria annulata]CAI73214.1 hypothetical protein TA06195 [Theileria annulata]|eukprot:XP_953892.1 hypothetical protein TA06195 [Theileria annulata]